MAAPQVGQPAPDFALKNLRGESVALRDVLQNGQHALLVFLRHLG